MASSNSSWVGFDSLDLSLSPRRSPNSQLTSGLFSLSSQAFPSTTSSSSRSSSSTPSFLRKLIFKRPTPSSSAMPSPSSSSSDRAQQPVRRIVHRPAAPSLGPLSKPHSEWRAQRSEDDEWRGRSGRRKTLRFDLVSRLDSTRSLTPCVVLARLGLTLSIPSLLNVLSDGCSPPPRPSSPSPLLDT